MKTINELSKKKLGDYIKKAADDTKEKSYVGGMGAALGAKVPEVLAGANKRVAGIKKATDKIVKESEMLDKETYKTIARDLVEATLGGAKHAGKDNPNTKWKRSLHGWGGKMTDVSGMEAHKTARVKQIIATAGSGGLDRYSKMDGDPKSPPKSPAGLQKKLAIRKIKQLDKKGLKEDSGKTK